MTDDRRIDLTAIDLDRAAALEARADQLAETAKRSKHAAPDDVKRLRARARALREHPPHAGQWVQLKERRTYGDVLRVRAASRRLNEDGRYVLDPESGTRAAIVVAIESWSFDPAVSPAAVDDLEPDVGDYLDRAIGERFASVGGEDDADTKD